MSACQYPYDASGTSLVSALVPRWAEAGGRDSLLARIAAPATHARLAAEMRENLRRRGGAAAMLIVSTRASPGSPASGSTRSPRRARWSPSRPRWTSSARVGDQSVASFNMNAKDIDTFMRADFVTTCSDGSDGHPRKFGTFPKKIRDYVLDRPVLTMERAIASSSAQPARDLQIAQRGSIAVGWFADVIVFDPKTIRDLLDVHRAGEARDRHAVGVREREAGGRERSADERRWRGGRCVSRGERPLDPRLVRMTIAAGTVRRGSGAPPKPPSSRSRPVRSVE